MNMISPRLVASFETDNYGNPAFVRRGDKNHYRVSFEVEDAPPSAYAATFELAPDYYDPVRTLRPDADGKFRLKTTTYGDFDVKVVLRTSDGKEQTLMANLKSALEKSLKSAAGQPKFIEALNDIAAH